MAEVKNIKINVDTASATQSMDNLAKATRDVSASFEEVYGDLQPLTTRMGEAEDRLYELANAGQTATQEYKDLLNTVANYRKVQIQTDMAVDAASSTFANKLGGALGGVTSGFAIAQGAMGAFGVESEDLEKQLLKVQSALAIAEGVRGFKEAIPSIKAFGAALKGAIGASGIGLLVIALGTVAAYWDDIKGAVSGVSAEQEKLNAQTQSNVDAQQAKFDSISGQENILRLQGKSEEDITRMKIKQIDAIIAATEAQMFQQENQKKAEVEATKRNQNYLRLVVRIGLEAAALVLRYLAAPIDLAIMAANKVSETLGLGKITAFNINSEITKMTEKGANAVAEYFFDPKATAAEADKTINETKAKITQLKDQRAGMLLSLQKDNEKEVKTETEKVDKVGQAKEDARKLEIERQQEFDKQLEDLAEQNYLNSLSDQERELRLVQDKYFELETLAQGNADQLAEIEIAKMNELNDINLKYQEEQYKINEEARAKEKEAQDKANEEKKEAEAAMVETMNALREADFNNASAGIDLVKNLFENNKKVQAAALIAESAVSVAKTIISTKAANQAARAQGTALSIATGGASVVAAEALILKNNISAGISIASQIAATAKGVAALGGGGTPPSNDNSPDGGGGGGGGTFAPSFNVVGNSGVNQLAQLQQTPVQAYVVSGQVTTAQSLDRNRVENATL